MGKRKSSKKPEPKKKQEKLSTVFSCPFCNHERSVECRMWKNLSNSVVKPTVRTAISGYYRLVSDDPSLLSRKTTPPGITLLVVHKGAGFHSCEIPLCLGQLPCFLTSEGDELLAKQKPFYSILQAETVLCTVEILLGEKKNYS